MIAETRSLYEHGVILALLARPERIGELVGVLLPEHFAVERCRFWYEAMLTVTGRGEPLDVAILGAELAHQGRFERCGFYSALFEMMPEAPLSVAHLKHYVREILAEAKRCRIAALAGQVAAGVDVDDELLHALKAAVAPLPVHEQSLGDVARSLAERSAAGLPLDGGFLESPWPDLNRAIIGFAPGTLTLVAARPGRGKTVFLTEVARHVAASGGPVLFFSLEMNREGIATRLLASVGAIDHTRVRRGWLTEKAEQDAVVQAAEAIADLKLIVDDRGAMSIQKLQATARAQKESGGLALVVVDYAQLATDPRAERRFEEMASVSRGLKELAKELRVPVVAAVQLNRQGEGEQTRLSHIRECGQFEQDADVIVFLWMSEAEEAKDVPVVEAWVMKNRQGPGTRVPLLFQKSLCRMVSTTRSRNGGGR